MGQKLVRNMNLGSSGLAKLVATTFPGRVSQLDKLEIRLRSAKLELARLWAERDNIISFW